MRPLIAVTGSISGADPFSPQAWSGSASRLVRELQRRGRLAAAFGVRARGLPALWPMLKTAHPSRARWRTRLSFEPGFHRVLTRALGERLDGLEGDLLQIGAYFDGPTARGRHGRAFAYHDGNLALRLASPYPLVGVGRGAIARALKAEGDLARRLDCVFTMSEWLRRSFIEDYGAPPERVVAIGGGVNLDRVPELPPDKDYARPEIVFVGVDFARKGGPELLQAFRAVRAQRRDAKLHLIGPPPRRLPAGQSGGVIQYGYLDKDAMHAVFARSSLFVMPSRYEPFGIAPLEAMACGLPAVVSGAWALAETVRPGLTGAHVIPGDVDHLAQTLLRLLDAPEHLAELGAAARAEVLQRFTWPAVLDRMEQSLRAVSAKDLPRTQSEITIL